MLFFKRNISPTDTAAMGIACFGEGWHNYHHVFPWDYKTSELSKYGYNFTIGFIDLFAKIGRYELLIYFSQFSTKYLFSSKGWAYDLKTVSEETIRKRMLRTGDGSNQYSNIKDLDATVKNFIEDYKNNNCKVEEMKNGNVWGWDDEDMTEEEKSLVKIYNKEKDY